jgi:3-deoxy-7-phosphoheptulonate synthase
MSEAKLATKTHPEHQTQIKINEQTTVGGEELLIIGGPCTVESLEQMEQVAEHLAKAPVQLLRGGVYKPRTSPYSFQGLGLEGLIILKGVSERYNVPVVTEVMSIPQIESVVAYADVLQIGSRNMQNFELLKAVGQAGYKGTRAERGSQIKRMRGKDGAFIAVFVCCLSTLVFL